MHGRPKKIGDKTLVHLELWCMSCQSSGNSGVFFRALATQVHDIHRFGAHISSFREMAVSNAFAPIRMFFAVAGFVALNVLASAQFDDWHMLSCNLFVKSTFAHGYIHGYEEGFHTGDLDMQMGRNYRDVKNHEKFKKPSGYKSQFGDKGTYEAGYRKGYRIGYVDSYEGRNFRAIALVRKAGPPGLDRVEFSFGREYDSGFRQGYETGQTQGLKDGRSDTKENAVPSECADISLAKGGAGEPAAHYCEAFRNGYELGYSDGFSNQRDRAKVLAKR